MTLPQYNWFVDDGNVSAALSNRNTGKDSTHPIAGEELSRRLGPRRLLADMAITCLSNSTIPALDLNLNGHQLTIAGQTTVNDSGTLSSFTAQNRATPTYNRLTLSGSASGAVAKLMRITSGARSGAVWWGVDNASGTVTVSTPVQLPTDVTSALLTRVTPAASDPYQTLVLPKLTIGAANIEGGSLVQATSPGTLLFQYLDLNLDTLRSSPYVLVRNSKLTSFWSPWRTDAAYVIGSNCHFVGFASNTGNVYATVRGYAGFASSSQLSFFGGSNSGTASSGGMLDYDFLLVNTSANVFGNASFGSVGIFGTGQVQVYGQLISTSLFDGVEAVWGNNSASVAMLVAPGGQYICSARPTATGNGGVAKVGQFTLAGWNQVPFADEGQNAMVSLQ